MFSVTLIMGFIITAIVLHYHRPPEPHHRYGDYAKKVVQRLNLPPAQHKDLTRYMDQFRHQVDTTKQELHEARTDMLTVLSKPGPLNRKQFDETNNAFNLLTEKKSQILRIHILTMRQKLGDEKGAQFFSEMLAKIKSHKRHP